VQDVGGIVERLLGFLEMGRDHVTAETLIQASAAQSLCIVRLSQGLVKQLQ
jgi:hypothetical protein